MLATSLSIENTSGRMLYSGFAADGFYIGGIDFWDFGDSELFLMML